MRWAALVVLAGCEASSTLVVQVRTDLVPVAQLAAIETILELPDGPEVIRLDATREGGWAAGVRVAERAGLEPGTLALEVSALDPDGARIVGRPVRVELRPGVVVATVLLTRDCGGVVCPGAEDAVDRTACLAGRCVRAGCVEEDAAECGAPGCALAADCPAPAAACATAECTPTGACFAAPDHGACGADQACSIVDGCVPACVGDGPFGPPVVHTEIGGLDPSEASLTEDGLHIYWSAEGPARLYEGRRRERGEYVLVRELTELRQPPLEIASGATGTEDRLEIIYRAYDGGSDDLWIATRPTPEDPFDPPARLALSSAGSADWCPELSFDGRELFFTSSRDGTTRIYRATRPTPSGDTFGDPEELAELGVAGEECASIAADDRTLVFGRDGDLYVATRSARGAPFTTPVPLAELNTADDEGAPELYEGGRAIAFSSHGTGDWEILTARRRCAP